MKTQTKITLLRTIALLAFIITAVSYVHNRYILTLTAFIVFVVLVVQSNKIVPKKLKKDAMARYCNQRKIYERLNSKTISLSIEEENELKQEINWKILKGTNKEFNLSPKSKTRI